MPFPPSLWSKTLSPPITPHSRNRALPPSIYSETISPRVPKSCPSSFSHTPFCLLHTIGEEGSTTPAISTCMPYPDQYFLPAWAIENLQRRGEDGEGNPNSRILTVSACHPPDLPPTPTRDSLTSILTSASSPYSPQQHQPWASTTAP